MNENNIPVSENNDVFIPEKDDVYTPFGYADDLTEIIASEKFFPVFVSGESGVGKTFIPKQVCAHQNREFCRVNITVETDEDDLLGGFRLINGSTVFHYGPVVQAMKNGAVLLLDEIALASEKVMCLQSVLEGEGIFIKKLGQWIEPADGFTVVATGNTKGRGSVDGRYIFNNILDEAMLERFKVNFEQDFPPENIETQILTKACNKLGLDSNDKETSRFIRSLVRWATVIRKSFKDGMQSDCLNTRRLISILDAYSVFNDELKSVKLGVTKFEEAVQEAFVESFRSVQVTADDDVADIAINADGTVKKRTNRPF